MGPPIVNLGFSEEFEEKVLGRPEDKGVEITVQGLLDLGKDLAKLGLGDFANAHGDVIDALERVWDEFIRSPSSDIVVELGDFIRDEHVAGQLAEKLKSYPDYYMQLHDPWLAAAMVAVEINLQCVDIIFNDILPHFEQLIEQKGHVLKLKIDKHIEKLGDDDGAQGGGSASEDDIDRAVEDALDEFFDEMDPDDFEPDDLTDFDHEIAGLSETLDDFEADLALICDTTDSEVSDRINQLLAQLNEIRARLAGPMSKVEGWSHMGAYALT